MNIMVDLEGTLTDHTDRLRVLQATTRDDPRDRTAWKTYYQGLIHDQPREYMLYAVKTWIRSPNVRVIVYSTRFLNKYNQEEEWLRGHELWEHVELLQRQPDQTKIKGPDLVAQWAVELLPHTLIDDRDDVRDLVRAANWKVLILSPEDFITRAA